MAKTKGRVGVKKTGGTSNVPSRLLPPVPFNAPAGSYDPTLDANVRASNRGLADLVTDTNTAQTRADYTQNLTADQIKQQRDWAQADITTGTQRGQQDYTTAKGYLSQDYQSNLAGLLRNYTRLGNNQDQQRAAAGVMSGGAAAQAARKRADNMAIDRQPLDTQFQRDNANLDTSWSRQQQDATTQADRLNTTADQNLAQNVVQGQWGAQDRQTTLTRGTRENQQFGADTQAVKVAQVQQTTPGWLDNWRKQNRSRGFRQF